MTRSDFPQSAQAGAFTGQYAPEFVAPESLPVGTLHNSLPGRSVANAHPASAITNTPAGNIASTDVQAALNELDTEKLGSGLAPTHIFVGSAGGVATDVTMSGDATIASSGAITVTKSGGVAFGSAAFVATTAFDAAGAAAAAQAASLPLHGTADAALTANTCTGNAATVTTNANLTGPITSVGNATAVASQTGTGTKFVMDTSPVLVTPTLGVASATTINKVTFTTPATGSTLTIADGKTFTCSNTLTFTGTDASSVAFGAGGTVMYTSTSVLAAQMPALTGDITTPAGAVATTLATTQSAVHTWSAVQTFNSGPVMANAVYLSAKDSGAVVRRILGVNASNNVFIGPFDASWAGTTTVGAGTTMSFAVNGASGGFTTACTIATTGSVTWTAAVLSSSPTAGVGYATGAGGTVTQLTNKATGVALSKVCGAITMNNAALAAGTIVSFVLTNTAIAATDVLVLNHISGGTVGAYTLNAQAAAGSATINVRNNTGGSLSEAIVIQFVVIKGVNA